MVLPTHSRARSLPSWITILCAFLSIIALGLAWWQHQRVGVKQDLQNQADTRLAMAPLSPVAAAALTATEIVWRRTELIGHYDHAGQFLQDNRSRQSQAGYYLIAPFALQHGDWVLINRGWMPTQRLRATTILPPPPAGTVTVAGIFVPDRAADFKLPGPIIEGLFWQRLDIALWEQRTGHKALPAVLTAEFAPAGLQAVVEHPDFRAASSRGYRLQWLALGFVFAIGCFIIARRR